MINKEEFLKKLQGEMLNQQSSNENGGSKEQMFTRKITEIMKQRDETNYVSVAFDEETNKRHKPHKVNAYAISDDSTELDLFITIYKPKSSVEYLSNDEIYALFGKLSNFYIKASEENYAAIKGETSEIYDCAYALGNDMDLVDKLEKIRFVLLTNLVCPDFHTRTTDDNGKQFTYEVVDLDRIIEMSQSENEPICVDFKAMGLDIQTIKCENDNDTYTSYLAIIPGYVLADLYDKYRVRLMENNVRQFLQFTGKVNKGIKDTIDNHPEMFMAYNNGIAATATSIELDRTGRYIIRINDLQIVNGGQTTASLFHARSDNNLKQFERIYVQMKISEIKKSEHFTEIVSNIARYANNQNKVSEADLHANMPQMERLELYSRNMMVQPNVWHNTAYYWFFERVKGQYNNLMLKEGFRKDLKANFEATYPKEQMFTKYDLAKYVCCFETKSATVLERNKPKEIHFGPHIACLGNEKVFEYYFKNVMPQDPNMIDSVYFEDVIAKAIMFMDADKRYGTKRTGAIGDLKKTVVPYALALLYQEVGGRIDWFKIWERQSISPEMSDLLYSLMYKVNDFIRHNSPIDRFDEWGKKQECWDTLRNQDWDIDISSIRSDLYPEGQPPRRHVREFGEGNEYIMAHQRKVVEAIPREIWDQILDWGESSGVFNAAQKIAVKEITRKVHNGQKLDDDEVERAIDIRDKVAQENIDILYMSDTFADEDAEKVQTPTFYKSTVGEKVRFMTDSVLEELWEFEKSHHMLPAYQDEQLKNYFNGKKDLTFKMKLALFFGLSDIKNRGFLLNIDTSNL